jgi:hypothetical protein
MSSIVIELQQAAVNTEIPVSALLMKAMVVARKLNLKDFQAWLENEMNGYKEGVTLPDYRVIVGQLKAFNPMRGWIPVSCKTRDEQEMFSKTVNGQSVSALESLLEQRTAKSSLSQPVSPEAHSLLNQLSEARFETQFQIFMQYSQIVNILSVVRNIILNWTLKLEEDGILGEGMTFTPQEKRQAEGTTYSNVNHFYGPVTGTQFQQGSTNSVQIAKQNNYDPQAIHGFTQALIKQLPKLGLDKDKQAEVKAEVASIEAQLNSPKPKASILKEGLNSLRTILEGAGGAAAGELLIQLGKHLFGG